MNKKGSITVFISLLLTVILSLILTSIMSVKVRAGRVQAINSADQAMFSLFAQYDKDLLSQYDVFFVDGAFGQADFSPGLIIDFLQDSSSYILNPTKGSLPVGKSLLNLTVENCSLKAYTLAGEQNGAVFSEQAIQYMKDTLPIQGVSDIFSRLYGDSENISNAEKSGQEKENFSIHDAYEEAKKAASEAREAAAQASSDTSDSASNVPIAEPPSDSVSEYVDPIPSIISFKHKKLLNMVIPEPSSISSKTLKTAALHSAGSGRSSLGVVELTEDISSVYNNLLLDKYILTHTGNYTKPESDAGIAYQSEYIIIGKNSDLENLDSIAKRLLLVRIGINYVLLTSNAALKSEAASAASAIAAGMLLPEIAPLIESIIIAGWTWCESIVDLRSLFSGNRIPINKSYEDWQTRIENIPNLFANIDSLTKNNSSGMNYEDYLFVFLTLSNKNTVRQRLMNVVENTIQTKYNRPAFKLDNCFDTLEAVLCVHSENRMTFNAERKYSYRPVSGCN